VPSHHIEQPSEIEAGWLDGVSTVGVTAGASTPDDVIQEVVDELDRLGYAPPEGGIRQVDPDYVPAF
jgi:4-hydroxy-3-methylbut-2-enyl diphosphate reductase